MLRALSERNYLNPIFGNKNNCPTIFKPPLSNYHSWSKKDFYFEQGEYRKRLQNIEKSKIGLNLKILYDKKSLLLIEALATKDHHGYFNFHL